MARIGCQAVWLGGLRRKSLGEKCEEALANIIDDLDEDRDGRVNIESFVDFMADYDIIISPAEVEEMTKLSDEKGELGKLALKTFVKYSWFWQDLEHKAEDIYRHSNRATIAFDVMDHNNDGFISKNEFGQALGEVKEDQIDSIFETYDESSDGRLSLSEFKNFMNQRKSLNKIKN